MSKSVIWHPWTQVKTASAPQKVVSGSGVFLTLADGRKLIDATSSWWVNLHGHAHPKIAEAIYKQSLRLEHVMFAGFSHEPAEHYVEKLQPHLPSHLNRFFFSDNGATSVEAALKMAFQYFWNLGKPRKTFVVFDGGYHGDTLGAASVSSIAVVAAPFEPLLFDVLRTPYPSTFWGDAEVEEKENRALLALENIFKERGEEIAAVVIEPLMQGLGGLRQARPQFFNEVEKIARRYGALIIFDEVMTGFGRTGTLFAVDQTTCKPDFICLSKAITGGFLPLALTVTTEKVYEAFLSDNVGKAFLHGHSYTGNPLGCVAATASLELLQEGRYKLMHDRMKERGSFLLTHPKVKKVRGLGAILAFDLDADEGYGSVLGKQFQKIVEEQGVLIRPFGEAVFITPPYTITDQELDSVFSALQLALDKI